MTSSLESLDRVQSPGAVLFAANRVEKTIRDVLDAYLHNVHYEPNRCGEVTRLLQVMEGADKCSQLIHTLCTVIKEQTKKLHRSLAANRTAAATFQTPALTGLLIEPVDRPLSSVVHFDGDDEDSRWKLIVHVVLGQDSDQSVLLSSRCIWNADTDCMASATYRNNSLFAVATVYGLRCDDTPLKLKDDRARLKTE